MATARKAVKAKGLAKRREGMTRRDEMMQREGMVSAAAAARALGCHISTVHRWMDEGVVEGTLVGGTWRYISRASLVAHVGEHVARQAGLLEGSTRTG